jgi:glycosyltransferase involved in cell wall biosynthesis
MSEAKLPNGVSAVIHLPADPPYEIKKFYQMIGALFSQYDQKVELIILDEMDDPAVEKEVSRMNTEANKVTFIRGRFGTPGEWLNEAVKRSSGDYLLYMDNGTAEIYLRQSALAALLLVFERNPDCGLVYTDYEIETAGEVKEIHLLKHHHGRVRDNQDYGRVLALKKKVLDKCGGFDAHLKFSTLYDIRLKISEHAELRHVSNRYAGSLYRVVAEGRGHNVFDYLLAGKDSQIEAEQVLTEHLKRTGAYLAPGAGYQNRPSSSGEISLKASVIIPVNNRAKFIGTAIESVLDQTVQDIECIVVVNGGPDDPTIAAVQKYMPGGEKHDPAKPEVRLLVLDVNNIGLCLNLGTKAARGEFYVQLDSDDRLKPVAVEKILQVFGSDPKIGMVIGSYEVWQLDDKTQQINRVESIPVVTHDEWTEENGRNNLLRINGAGAPRSIPFKVIKDIGYFGINDEPFARNYGEDYEMVLKISEKHRIGRVWEPIYDVVRHSGGTDHSIDQATIDRNDEAKDFMRMEAISRRKAGSRI